MELNIQEWMNHYLNCLKARFGSRLRFVGLQGSRARGEAKQGSDIDVVAVLDELNWADLQDYGRLLEDLPCREWICGFVSGWQELMNWDGGELLALYYDTLPFYGSLDALLECIDAASVKACIRKDIGGIYHGCAHNLLHERDEVLLQNLYKSAEFVLKAIYYLRTGSYLRGRSELMAVLTGADGDIFQTAQLIRSGAPIEMEGMSRKLFLWSGNLLREDLKIFR